MHHEFLKYAQSLPARRMEVKDVYKDHRCLLITLDHIRVLLTCLPGGWQHIETQNLPTQPQASGLTLVLLHTVPFRPQVHLNGS